MSTFILLKKWGILSVFVLSLGLLSACDNSGESFINVTEPQSGAALTAGTRTVLGDIVINDCADEDVTMECIAPDPESVACAVVGDPVFSCDLSFNYWMCAIFCADTYVGCLQESDGSCEFYIPDTSLADIDVGVVDCTVENACTVEFAVDTQVDTDGDGETDSTDTDDDGNDIADADQTDCDGVLCTFGSVDVNANGIPDLFDFDFDQEDSDDDAVADSMDTQDNPS